MPEPSQSLSEPEAEEVPERVERSVEPRSGDGDLTLLIRGGHDYAYWEELQSFLEGQVKSIQVQGIELSPEGAKVKLQGIDPQYIVSLQGAQIGKGVTVQVGRVSPDARTISLTLSPSGSLPGEQGQ
jgi:hypothetical protein